MNSKETILYKKYPKFYDFIYSCKFFLGYKRKIKYLDQKLVLASTTAFYPTSSILDLTEKKMIEANIRKIENELDNIKQKLGIECYEVFVSLYVIRNTQEYVATQLNISERQLRRKIADWRNQYEQI